MADPEVPKGSDALSNLATRVAQARQERLDGEPKAAIDRSGMSLGLRLASEFASAILVGGLLGYGVDFLASSSPWGLLFGLSLGFAAGTVTIVKAAKRLSVNAPIGNPVVDETDSQNDT